MGCDRCTELSNQQDLGIVCVLRTVGRRWFPLAWLLEMTGGRGRPDHPRPKEEGEKAWEMCVMDELGI